MYHKFKSITHLRTAVEVLDEFIGQHRIGNPNFGIGFSKKDSCQDVHLLHHILHTIYQTAPVSPF